MAISLKKTSSSFLPGNQYAAANALVRERSIAEVLADRDARNAFALATGFSLDDTPSAIEKEARRARYARRQQGRGGSK